MIRKCLNCKQEISVIAPHTKYCKMCAKMISKRNHDNWVERNKEKWNEYHKEKKRSKTLKKNLDKFYKNLRINLIQSPYFIERRKIELPVL